MHQQRRCRRRAELPAAVVHRSQHQVAITTVSFLDPQPPKISPSGATSKEIAGRLPQLRPSADDADPRSPVSVQRCESVYTILRPSSNHCLLSHCTPMGESGRCCYCTAAGTRHCRRSRRSHAGARRWLGRRRPPLPVIAAGALTVSGCPDCTSSIASTSSTFSLLGSTAVAPPIVDANAIFAAAPAQPVLPAREREGRTENV
uniref:Uncharacterized protein n=1 Tax=Leersia perrieri TaxID=77586 RepID=A0A0D9X7L4_9ORYZ